MVILEMIEYLTKEVGGDMLGLSTECSVRELRDVLNAGMECYVIDVREYPEYAMGHIAGARLMPLGTLTTRATELDRSLPIYVICRTGRRAAQAQERLSALGFQDVRNVRGGITAWQEEKFPLVGDKRAVWSLERQVRLVVGVLVLSVVLLSVTVSSYFIWLAGFVGLGLIFAGITDSCAMAMLIAKLPWNRSSKSANCVRVENS
jgi:rhodanese-related sulfurtransferase